MWHHWWMEFQWGRVYFIPYTKAKYYSYIHYSSYLWLEEHLHQWLQPTKKVYKRTTFRPSIYLFSSQTTFLFTTTRNISTIKMAAYESLEFEQLKTSPLGQCIGMSTHLIQHLTTRDAMTLTFASLSPCRSRFFCSWIHHRCCHWWVLCSCHQHDQSRSPNSCSWSFRR